MTAIFPRSVIAVAAPVAAAAAVVAAFLPTSGAAQGAGADMPANCRQNLDRCSQEVWPRNSFPHRGSQQSTTFSDGATLTCTSNGSNIARTCALTGPPADNGGDTSDQVRSVQKALGDLGYDPGPSDGRLSPKTEDAIRAYQAANGLPRTGRIDEPTLRKLGLAQSSERTADYAGDTGDQVRSVQRALGDLGYDPGPLDGRLSPKTEDAIRAYQAANGLPRTGRIDEPTLRKLGLQ